MSVYYNELLTFLNSSTRPDIQKETLKIILHVLQSSSTTSESDLSTSNDPFMFFQAENVLDIFMNLLKIPELAYYTITILNFLITSPCTSPPLQTTPPSESLESTPSSAITFPSRQYSEQIITILLTYLLTSSNPSLINISLVLLTNLTIPFEIMEILQQKIHMNTNLFHKLFMNFLETPPSNLPNEENMEVELDSWQYFSSVLCNLCRHQQIQLLLLNKSSNYMTLLLNQIASKNPIRRRGVVGSIRSCLFQNDFHWWLVEELNITTPLLLPLLVNTPFTDEEKIGMDPILYSQGPDKTPDNDFEIQKMLLESLLILCHTRVIRERLRVKKVYPILRNLDYHQDNEEISTAIYEVVSQLIGNEDPSNPSQLLQQPQPQQQLNEADRVDTKLEESEEELEMTNPYDDVD